MWNKLIIKALVIAVLMCTGNLYAQQMDGQLKPLKRLLGTWEMSTHESRIIESWSYAGPKSLHGKSLKIDLNNDTIVLERIKIEVVGRRLLYIPIAEGQNSGQPVEFTLLSAKDGKYVFENKLHDFPQRIVYWFRSANELLAWVEGEKDGKPGKVEFNYRRVR